MMRIFLLIKDYDHNIRRQFLYRLVFPKTSILSKSDPLTTGGVSRSIFKIEWEFY